MPPTVAGYVVCDRSNIKDIRRSPVAARAATAQPGSAGPSGRPGRPPRRRGRGAGAEQCVTLHTNTAIADRDRHPRTRAADTRDLAMTLIGEWVYVHIAHLISSQITTEYCIISSSSAVFIIALCKRLL